MRGPGFGRSPGDAVYDPMWARLAEAGILTAYHSGDSGYGRYADEWGSGGDFQAFRNDPFRTVTGGHRPIYDTIAALVCHGVFTRHPNLRVATIESGSDWVPLLLRALKKSYGQVPDRVRRRTTRCSSCATTCGCRRTTRTTSPQLRDELGANRMIFGSDYPHAEGLADPLAFVDDLPGFSDDEIRLVMRENALALSVAATDDRRRPWPTTTSRTSTRDTFTYDGKTRTRLPAGHRPGRDRDRGDAGHLAEGARFRASSRRDRLHRSGAAPVRRARP